MHGVLGQLGIGHVPLHTMHRQAPTEGSPSADFDGVADRGFAGGLAHHAPVYALAPRGERLDHALGPIDRGAFLIAGDEIGDRAFVTGMGADELLRRREHRGESALHIGRATAVKDSIADGRHERVRTPFLERPGRHHIRMSGEAQHRSAAPVPGPEVLDIAKGQGLDRKAQSRQTLGHDLLAALVRRRHGAARHQILSQLKGFGHSRSRCSLSEP